MSGNKFQIRNKYCHLELGTFNFYHIYFFCYYSTLQFLINPMASLKQARDMFRLQKEAKKIKKELKNIHVEAEASGVTVTVSAEQTVVDIKIDPSVDRDAIPNLLIDALNRAFKKAQIVSSEKMQAIMGDMGMPTEEGMRGMSS